LLGGSSLSRSKGFRVLPWPRNLASLKRLFRRKKSGGPRVVSIVNMDFFFPQRFPQFLFCVSVSRSPQMFVFLFDNPNPHHTLTHLDWTSCGGVLAHDGAGGWRKTQWPLLSRHIWWNGVSKTRPAATSHRTCDHVIVVLQMHRLRLPCPENKRKKSYSLNKLVLLVVIVLNACHE
jgi:hypothetical protein